MSLVSAAPVQAGPDDPEPVLEVIGGVRAEPGDFPWVVRLSTGCSGTLTAPRFVLTAAHCVGRSGATDRIRVIAGSTDLESPDAAVLRSTRVRRAAGFRSATAGDDWAVIELEHALDLPTLPRSDDPAAERGVFTVVGWGSTSVRSDRQQRHLRAAEVSYVDDEACGSAYRSAGYELVAQDMICAGNVRERADSCQGDSGGPMIGRDAGGRRVQVGIVSWGYGCARRGFPGVYTRVSRFAADIRAASAPAGGPDVGGGTAEKLVPTGM